MGAWFGEPWPEDWREHGRAPVCADDAERVPVPVGEPCLHCVEVIGPSDQGTLMPCIEQGPHGLAAVLRPVHAECLLRMTLGGPAHLMGLCSCHGGDADVQDPDLGMSPRDAARAVRDWVQAHGI